MMFQIIAPPRAARTIESFTTAGLMIPVPMVLATWTPTKKTAANSKNAAHRTAYFGGSTLVETTVEIALAESWKPLRKSKTKATRMRKITKPRESGMLQDDSFYYV